MKNHPLVSIIVPSYNARATIARCLKSLRSQTAMGAFEVLVIDSSEDGTHGLVQEMFPEVTVYHFDERKYCGDARNIGISLARGEVVAQIDADCEAAKDWVERIIAAHQTGDMAVGGAIGNGNPQSYVGWGAYFCEFTQWMPGTKPGWMADIAGANMTYKKDLFNHYGAFIEGTYGSDSEFHWRLAQRGVGIRFEPSMVVYHGNINRLGAFILHTYQHGRDFGRVRISYQRFSCFRRMLYVGAFPLLVGKVFVDRLVNNLSNRIYWPQFCRAIPILALGVVCWSAGELAAYVRGKHHFSKPLA
jgi:glycosyltransferase involved in cell wall biosynthesis